MSDYNVDFRRLLIAYLWWLDGEKISDKDKNDLVVGFCQLNSPFADTIGETKG